MTMLKAPPRVKPSWERDRPRQAAVSVRPDRPVRTEAAETPDEREARLIEDHARVSAQAVQEALDAERSAAMAELQTQAEMENAVRDAVGAGHDANQRLVRVEAALRTGDLSSFLTEPTPE